MHLSPKAEAAVYTHTHRDRKTDRHAASELKRKIMKNNKMSGTSATTVPEYKMSSSYNTADVFIARYFGGHNHHATAGNVQHGRDSLKVLYTRSVAIFFFSSLKKGGREKQLPGQ